MNQDEAPASPSPMYFLRVKVNRGEAERVIELHLFSETEGEPRWRPSLYLGGGNYFEDGRLYEGRSISF